MQIVSIDFQRAIRYKIKTNRVHPFTRVYINCSIGLKITLNIDNYDQKDSSVKIAAPHNLQCFITKSGCSNLWRRQMSSLSVICTWLLCQSQSKQVALSHGLVRSYPLVNPLESSIMVGV